MAQRNAAGHAGNALWCWAMVAVAAVVLANALLFAGRVANPLIYSDNWTFVDTFLRVALEQGAGFGDFLVKRAGVDHAQPINKLLMLLNQRWFGLDFALESRIAMACAVVAWALLCVIAWRDVSVRGLRDRHAGTLATVLVAIAAVHLSLASSDIYSYPMVTMAHALYLIAFLAMVAAWLALSRGWYWPLLLSSLVFGIAGDDSAILLTTAITLGSLLHCLRSGRWRALWPTLAVLIGTLLVCRMIYATLGEIRGATNPDFNVGMAQHLAGLAAQWRDAWQWVAVPLTAGVAGARSLQNLFGEHWLAARIMLAIVMVAAHGWFWCAALRTRVGATWMVAMSTMLLFYANVAGIVYGRVFVRGALFLDQTRYVVFYQLGVVALLLMAAATLAAASSRRARRFIATSAIALLLVQVPLSLHAWQGVEGYRGQYRLMARDMQAMAIDPLHVPPGCTVGVDVCARDAPTRVRLMAMLVRHRVNIFSPTFQQRHPELADAARQVGPVPTPKPAVPATTRSDTR